MNKLAMLILLVLAACVALVAIIENSAGAQGPNFIDHYKCYQARHAKGSSRFTPQTVFLTDQFRHNVQVSVLKLDAHCSLADQNLTPTPTRVVGELVDLGLDCYTIRDAPRQPRFTPQNLRVSDKLTNYQDQTLTVSKAQRLCVPAHKTQKFNGTLEGEGFVCYQAKTANGQPRFVQRNIFIHDQFGDKLARVIRPVAFCATSEKKVDATNDNFGDATEVLDENLQGHLYNDHSSTIHATSESNDPIISCKTQYTNSVWYDWSSQQNLSLLINTQSSTYNTVVAVFTGNKGSLHELACKENPTAFDALQVDAWAGTSTPIIYHILVGSSDGHGGKLKFHIGAKGNLGNADSCNSPVALTQLQRKGESRLEHVSTMNATVAGGACSGSDPDLSCTGSYGASAWFSYTSTVSGNDQLVNFDSTASSYNTVIGVLDTTLNTPTGEVACGANGFVAASLTAGHKYLIVVGAAGSSARGGKLKLNYSLKRQLINPPLDQSAGVGVGAAFPLDSLTCYEVRQARHPARNDSVFDQFSIRQLSGDPWLLTIGGVDSVCVPSFKDPCHSGAEDGLEPAAPPQLTC